MRYQEDAKDNQYHLACLSSLFRTLHPNLAVAGGLCQASFWIYLRQDIYISFVNKAPIKTNLDNFQLDRTFSPADDCTWANRITFKCAEILHFAFPESSTPAPSQTAWERLMDDVETWRMKRPAGFEMIYHAPRDPTEGKWFPDMWYTLDCHATGMQYYHLCRILLAIYNPANPGIHDGPSVARDASERLTQEVKDNVRAICGIAQSNRPEPAYFTACHAVVVCGVWFEDGMERRAMLKLLEDTERRSGWQTEKARKSLREMWGIPENDMESRERKEGPGICVNRGVGKMEEMW